jgi:hypothetical protein
MTKYSTSNLFGPPENPNPFAEPAPRVEIKGITKSP